MQNSSVVTPHTIEFSIEMYVMWQLNIIYICIIMRNTEHYDFFKFTKNLQCKWVIQNNGSYLYFEKLRFMFVIYCKFLEA